MNPGARIQALIELLHAVESSTGAADDVLRHELRQRPYVGAGDRRWLTDGVHGVHRRRAQIDWWIAHASEGSLIPDARTRALAQALLGDRWKAADLERECSGDAHRATPISADESRLALAMEGRDFEHEAQPRAIRLGLPEWIEPLLAEALGDDLEPEARALMEQAPLDLRVNLLAVTREQARAALAEQDISAEPTKLSPLGLRLARRLPLGEVAAFRDGRVEVQDEASQIGALLVGARPGERVVDFCAGACGKTLVLASAMSNRGRIVALDVSMTRLERAVPRLRRAGVHCVERRSIESERDPWIKRHASSFDRVLVDAPCTGTGTWRRNPESRWRIGPENLESLVATQASVLDSACRLVRPGGRLVYSTCSLLREENETQVTAFLSRHPEFQLVPVQEAWKASLPGEAPTAEPMLRLSPARHGTDGFFVAIMSRGGDQ